MNSILTTRKLCKTYSNGGIQQHILKNLDLEVYEKDFTIIMGPSGAGKSTLLYSLSGMDKPSLGEIIYKNTNISELTDDKLSAFRKQSCGFVFQQIYLIDKMSVMDNVLACGYLKDNNRKKVVQRAKELFEKVNISEELYRKFPSQLSGGEQQRVAIVRGLINQPDLLFADEPTGALNSSNADAVLNVLSEFHREGQSIILVTHDIKTALRGNRIIYIKDGTIFGECRPGDYKEQGGNSERRQKLETFLREMGW